MASTYRYKFYDIETGDNFANVLGVSGQVVKSFKTEKQAKSWIDREYKLSQERVNTTTLQAWYIGDDTWNIATKNGGTETVGRVHIQTTRRCVEDVSGLKQFKVICQNTLQLTVRLGYNTNITLAEPFVEYGGPRAALRKAMDALGEGHISYHLRTQIEQQLREVGFSEWQIMDAYDSDWRKHCQNLADLLPKEATQ